MTIRKNDPNSEFWKDAEKASKQVETFPPWKLGILDKKINKDWYLNQKIKENMKKIINTKMYTESIQTTTYIENDVEYTETITKHYENGELTTTSTTVSKTTGLNNSVTEELPKQSPKIDLVLKDELTKEFCSEIDADLETIEKLKIDKLVDNLDHPDLKHLSNLVEKSKYENVKDGPGVIKRREDDSELDANFNDLLSGEFSVDNTPLKLAIDKGLNSGTPIDSKQAFNEVKSVLNDKCVADKVEQEPNKEEESLYDQFEMLKNSILNVKVDDNNLIDLKNTLTNLKSFLEKLNEHFPETSTVNLKPLYDKVMSQMFRDGKAIRGKSEKQDNENSLNTLNQLFETSDLDEMKKLIDSNEVKNIKYIFDIVKKFTRAKDRIDQFESFFNKINGNHIDLTKDNVKRNRPTIKRNTEPEAVVESGQLSKEELSKIVKENSNKKIKTDHLFENKLQTNYFQVLTAPKMNELVWTELKKLNAKIIDTYNNAFYVDAESVKKDDLLNIKGVLSVLHVDSFPCTKFEEPVNDLLNNINKESVNYIVGGFIPSCCNPIFYK